MQDAKESNLAHLDLLISATGTGVWDWDIQSGEVYLNENCADIVGYELNELQPIQFDTWVKHIHAEDLFKAKEQLANHVKGQTKVYEVEARIKHKQGHFVWVLITGKTIAWADDGKPSRIIGFHQNISQRKLNEQQLTTATHILDESQHLAKVGGWQLDIASGDLFWTAETYHLHDTSPKEFNPTVDAGVGYYLPESQPIITEALEKAINQGIGYDLTLKTYTAKGRIIDVRTTCTVTMKNAKAIKLTGIFQDISEEKSIQRRFLQSNHELEQLNAKLSRHANYDSLTGLPNRNLLEDRMEQTIARTQRNNHSVAIAFIDLDHFKEINDTYGHSFGDDFLCTIGEQLKHSMRSCDTLARFGGDEFVMILDKLQHPDECIPILNRILDSVAKTSFINNKSIQVSASIGVTIYPQDNSDPVQLMRHADQAMYIAKNLGKNCFHIFDVAKDVAAKHQSEELENIRLALKNEEFELYYQPKLNLKTNKIIGVEALIRWCHPIKGILPPITFLPLIEQDILNIEVGEWVIRQALTQLSLWAEQGIYMPISVNISPLQLQDEDFAHRLQEIFEVFPHFKAGCIEFEILETSALKEIEQVAKVIHECHNLGIKFSIDDFGTGYSSLTYLKRLPTECLKIDQSFIRDMLNDENDKSIVQGIIGLAQAFELSVIAEGVETTAHGEQLLSLSCHLVQGYGIAKPMPAESFPEWFFAWQEKNNWQYLSDNS